MFILVGLIFNLVGSVYLMSATSILEGSEVGLTINDENGRNIAPTITVIDNRTYNLGLYLLIVGFILEFLGILIGEYLPNKILSIKI